MILLQNGSRDPKLYNWQKTNSVSIFSICTAPLQESVQSHPKVFKVTPLFKVTPVYGILKVGMFIHTGLVSLQICK